MEINNFELRRVLFIEEIKFYYLVDTWPLYYRLIFFCSKLESYLGRIQFATFIYLNNFPVDYIKELVSIFYPNLTYRNKVKTYMLLVRFSILSEHLLANYSSYNIFTKRIENLNKQPIPVVTSGSVRYNLISRHCFYVLRQLDLIPNINPNRLNHLYESLTD